jgi:hypothetical protein
VVSSRGNLEVYISRPVDARHACMPATVAAGTGMKLALSISHDWRTISDGVALARLRPGGKPGEIMAGSRIRDPVLLCVLSPGAEMVVGEQSIANTAKGTEIQ